MTQDMNQNMTLHAIIKQLILNWRTRVLSGAHSSSLTGTLRTFLLLVMMVVGVSEMWGQTNITSLSQITATDGHYVITQDITGGTPGVSTFSGTLEANIDPTTKMPYRIKDLSAPLFTTLTGTVKNLVFENVAITSGDANGNTGAIACNMTGTLTNKAVIYNCGILSGRVSGSGNVGGLVGQLGQGTPASTDAEKNNCYARVINCYSFADIEGGSVRAGIVGYNSYDSKYDDQRTMVMNCMFYGEIDYTSGTLSPIYGGQEINNTNLKNDDGITINNRLNNYNYFLYEADYSKNKKINTYNCALAAEKRYLNRFEFYRNLVNSTRELAAWYATGNVNDGKGENCAMAKWVLDKSIAPYPILKAQGKYPSVVNYDPDYTNTATGAKVSRSSVTQRNQGGILTNMGSSGTLSVTISSTKTDGGQAWPTGATITQTEPLSLNIIDKDYNNFNYNYGKVQLPYYNDVGTKNYTKNNTDEKSRVVTGWKIISMTGGTQGTSFTEADEWGGYNFADRSTYGKDLYDVSGRVFSQGAYLDVPDGVTGITIEPYWGYAVYLSDKYHDKYISNTNITVSDVNITNAVRYNQNKSGGYDINGVNQKVYTSIKDAIDNLGRESSGTVYDYAVVLVGNFHQSGTPRNDALPFTIMSADLNFDNEPDNSFIFRSGKQEVISPIRFDFVNVPGLAMAHKVAAETNNNMSIPGNLKLKGWFEITNTCMIRFTQFETSYESKSDAPVILLGGVIDQIVSTNSKLSNNPSNPPNHTTYIHLGSNVCFPLVFNNGLHMDHPYPTKHIPISVTGGDYEKFYLSGYLRPYANTYMNDNAECYISGGRFGEVAGAGYEQIDGDVKWLIDRADITDFYGGGINDKKPITGNIEVIIKNSYVTQYCGGPKFGNMVKKADSPLSIQTSSDDNQTKDQNFVYTEKTITDDRTVKTTATNCVFGTYYGAGYGGTAFVRKNTFNDFQKVNYPWNSSIATTFTSGNDKRGKYDANNGIAVTYEYRQFEGSSTNTVGHFYVNYASLSLAQANNVTSELTGCEISGNFYGGGSFGKVDGDIKSTLTDCTVNGSVFGAGFSGDAPEVEVFPALVFSTEPKYNTSTGVFEAGIYPTPVTLYKWSNTKGGNTNTTTLISDNEGNWIHTDVSLSGLGTVAGNVDLTLKGGTTVNGSVYGGGDDSAVTGSTHKITVTLAGNTTINGNVYGGGNKGLVEGSTEVNIQQNAPTSNNNSSSNP